MEFLYSQRDAYGCTHIPPNLFCGALKLSRKKPVTIHRPDGSVYHIDAYKCRSRDSLHYQMDLRELDIPAGAIVTLWPGHTANHLVLTVDHPSQHIWERRGVVDAIVSLQKRVEILESVLENAT